MKSGSLFKFTERDPEDGRIYMHYFDSKEIIAYIEVNFLIPESQKYAVIYEQIHGRDIIHDYKTEIIDNIPNLCFVKRCLMVFNIFDVDLIYVKHDMAIHDMYVLIDNTWYPYYGDESLF